MANGIREVSSKLIGNMPENHIASFSEPLCQFPVNCRDFLTHHRRGVAEIVALSRQISSAVRLHLHHFRIFLSEPVGHCPGRGCQDNLNSFRFKSCDDPVHPVKLIDALFRFQRSPGKNAKAYAVYVRFFHQRYIFFKNLRVVQPLIRIVISTVENPFS